MKRKEYLARFLLLVGSIVVSGLLAEAALWATEYRYILIQPGYGFPRGYFQADNELGYINAPDFGAAPHYFEGPTYTIFTNALGYFDRPYVGETSVGLAIGDSYTWGYTELENKWTTVVERRTGARILKCGVPGSGTRYQYLWLKRLVAMGVRPSFVILLYAGNDWNDDFMHDSDTVVGGVRVNRISSLNLRDGSVVYRDEEQIERIAEPVIKRYEEGENQSYRGYSILFQMYMDYAHKYIVGGLSKIFPGLEASAGTPIIERETIKHKNAVSFWALAKALKSTGEYRPWLRTSLEAHHRNIVQFSEYCRRIGADLFFADAKDLTARKETSDLIGMLSAQAHFHYVNVTKEMEKRNTTGRAIRWLFNGHWNVFGNELVGTIIADYIRAEFRPTEG